MHHALLTLLLHLIVSVTTEAKKDPIGTPPPHPVQGTTTKQQAPVAIDSLKVGQKYLVTVASSGCFHYTDLFLAISKTKDGYYATFKARGEIQNQQIHHNYKRTKLTDRQLDSVRSFEKKLLQLSAQSYHCTTVDTYRLTIGASTNQFRIDDCDWNGIGKLVGFLFRRPA
jgi:hypothetical protein